jgi:hypothetical protein
MDITSHSFTHDYDKFVAACTDKKNRLFKVQTGQGRVIERFPILAVSRVVLYPKRIHSAAHVRLCKIQSEWHFLGSVFGRSIGFIL